MRKVTPIWKKVISGYLAVSLFVSSIFPSNVSAITGPSAPEFSSFEPVSSNGMVNDFSGDLTYNLPVLNIPGADGGGYALSLSYKSGTSPEDDPSWVGYGWTLNPGAIIRSKNGFPDDYNGVSVTSYNDIPVNWTAGLGVNAGVTVEGFSLSATLGQTMLLQYNNHQGFAYISVPSIGVGLGYGVVSLNLALEDGGGSFSAQVNPANAMQFFKKQGEKEENKSLKDKTVKAPQFKASAQLNRMAKEGIGTANSYSNAFLSYATSNSSRNSNISSFTGNSFKLQVGIQYDPAGVPIGLGADAFMTFSYQKPTTPSETNTCYGFLYSANATVGETTMMDYYTEKDQGFNKRDQYMSIPFSRPDQFILMGEGLSGGFRAFSKKAGHFRINEKENQTNLFQLGFDVMAGLDLGLGGSFQTGSHKITVGEWDDNGRNDDYEFSNEGDEPFYMAFMMDPSQYMTYGGDEMDLQAEAFSIEETNGTIGMKAYEAKHPSSLVSEVNNVTNLDLGIETDRIPRSSQVIYHTNSQMTQKDNGSNYYNRYSRPSESHETYLTTTRSELADQIGEFVVYNNVGNRYVYGLPVYTKNEKNFSFDISNPSKDYIVAEDIDDYDRKVGDEITTPYATSFLLTNITTPNYIDRTMDGPTSDDFGGWTKFNYTQKYGRYTGTYYKWRVPYNGLFNNPGSLTDDKDDMGSCSSGEKEVYYLEDVETKTHIAKFFTSDRLDGYEAADDASAAKVLSGAQGSNTLQRLDSIYLYSKDESGAAADVIKRIYFCYDYSLMQDVPNSKGTGSDKGVLTLRKVWFEYGEVRNAKISPYEFSYSYPTTDYPAKYNSLENYGSGLTENPNYDKLNIDRWGNYQYNGDERLDSLNPWVNQNSSSAFDPAAWQLKVITLPTGGQIHAQYEQDDYLYVQDRRAMVMASISSVDNDLDGGEGTLGDKFYLNLSELGISTTEEKEELVELLEDQFINGQGGKDPEKIYFKFLYSLLLGRAGLEECGSDIIEGYVNVAGVGSDGTGVYIQLGSSTAGTTELLDDDEEYSVPRDVCIDFYDKTRSGNINSSDVGCQIEGMTSAASSSDEVSDSEAEEAMYNLLGLLSNLNSLIVEDHSYLCLDIDEANSYIRIPSVKAKKGGGIRVKRLLMYEGGLEANDATLYGKEYVYQNTDGLSSGVATNEPSMGREENALIGYMDKRGDSEWYQKVISGEDLEQFEGPIGEALLPGASVGYARVIAKNIHTDKKTHDGASVSEFYTAKDYPFDGTYSYTAADGSKVDFNGIDITEMNQETDWLPVYTLIYNRVVSNIWASQGYRFVINDMNGKPKRNAIYSGNYDYINTPDSVQLESGIEYEYYEPGEPVKVTNRWEWADEADMDPEYRVLGKQMDVVMESRAIKDNLTDYTIEVDVSIGVWGPVVIPYVTGMIYVNETINELYTHVTNKVLYLPSMLKSTRKYQEGVYVDSKDEFFNATTGAPIVNITNDGFNNLTLNGSTHDGRYVNYAFPASHYYDGMKLRGNTDEYHIGSPSSFLKKYDATTGTYLEYTGSNSCALNVFTEGDLVVLTSTTGVVEAYNVGEIVGRTLELLPNGDFYYNTTNYSMSDIYIARTARTNQVSEKAGALTTYGGYPDVTQVAIDQAILDARQQVADALNTAISSTGSVTVSLTYSDVYIMDGDSCIPLSTSVTSNRYTETISYTDFDTIINCYPVNCVFGSSSTSTTGTVAGGTASGSSTENTTTTGTTTDGSGTTSKDGQTNTNQDQTGNTNTSTTTTGNIKGGNNGGKTEPISKVPYLDSYPTSDKYVYDSKTGTYICWDCDTTIAKVNKTTKIRKVELTVGSCTITFDYINGYGFYIDEEMGELMYGDTVNASCDAVRVECFDFCPDQYSSIELDGVVASAASSISDDWDLTSTLKDIYNIPGTTTPDLNKYEYGAKGKWHCKNTYDYNTSLSNINATDGRAWNTGIYDDFTVFNWDYEGANDSVWTKLVTTTKVSPLSITLEEQNAMDIYSALKMGYNFSVPYLTAVNSPYENVMFEGFETANETGTSLSCEDNYAVSQISGYYGDLVSDTAHSGDKSLRMKFVKSTSSSGSGMAMILTNIYESELALQAIQLDDQTINEGVSIKFWLKSDKTLTDLSLKYSKYTTALVSTSTSFTKIAQTGEWTLYEAKITDFGSDIRSVASSVTPSIYFKYSGLSTFATTSPKTYVDDLRMQPLDAQVSAFVYDPTTLQLIASFDDQHFGLFYQYNGEGKLIRKLKETVEGVKTIIETQYNTPLNSSRPY